MLLRALVVLAALVLPDLPAAARPPNVVFIVADELRADALGSTGHRLVATPHIDALAREGTRFDRAFTVAPICTPSRYSLFTSRYPHVHGSTANNTPVGEPQVLLPSLLHHYGYETAISGKLHFIPRRLAYGFDRFWSSGVEGPGLLPSWPRDMEDKYGPGVADELVLQPFPDDPVGHDLGKLSYPKEDTQTFWITDRAIEMLGERDAAKPFFLYVSYLDPHSPSHLAEPYWSRAQALDPPLPSSFRAGPDSFAPSAANRHQVRDPKVVKAMIAAYDTKIGMVDDNVGRLLDRLEAAGLARDTIVVFTSDHGNMTGDRNRWFKGCMYEGCVAVPLIVKAAPSGAYAASFNTGKVVSRIVESIDVMPTLLEMVGHPLPAQLGFQGKSLVPLVAGRAASWDDVAFSERGGRMVRTPEWKLIQNSDADVGQGAKPYELYHLPSDPLEQRNRIDDPTCAQVRQELLARLNAWSAERPPVPAIDGVAPEPANAPPRRGAGSGPGGSPRP